MSSLLFFSLLQTFPSTEQRTSNFSMSYWLTWSSVVKLPFSKEIEVSIHMAKLGINQLKAGMKTNSEVVDQHGHTLIRANEDISDSHITLLKMWWVYEIDIKDAACIINLDYLKSQYPTRLIESLLEEANKKYQQFNPESQLCNFLKKTYVEHAAKREV